MFETGIVLLFYSCFVLCDLCRTCSPRAGVDYFSGTFSSPGGVQRWLVVEEETLRGERDATFGVGEGTKAGLGLCDLRFSWSLCLV